DLDAVVGAVVGHGDFLARGQGVHAAAVDAVFVLADLLPVVRGRVVRDGGGVVGAGGFDADIADSSWFTEGAHLGRSGGDLGISGAVGGNQGEGVVVGVLHLHFPGGGPAPGGEGLDLIAVLEHRQLVAADGVTIGGRGRPLDHQPATGGIIDAGRLRC